MKKLPASKLLFIAALVLILLVNAFILIGVGYNRSGEPSSVVILTEREVNIPYRWSREDTSVRLDWRILLPEGDKYNRYNSPAWFDQQKLETLGFEFVDNSDGKTQTHFIEAEAILVLEYDGSAYQQTIKNAKARIVVIENKLARLKDDEDLLLDLKAAKENLRHEELSASRLFVIDAGLNEESLRVQYPDKNKYILAHGIVDARSYWAYGNNQDSFIAGYIDRLSVEYLHVENESYSLLKNLKANSNYSRNESPPRFSLEVHYGQRLEPWVEFVKLI